MINLSSELSTTDLSAIRDLERRVVAADGGRLKLEWNALRDRSGQDIENVLWWDGERLLGFLGIYTHGAPTIEMAVTIACVFGARWCSLSNTVGYMS